MACFEPNFNLYMAQLFCANFMVSDNMSRHLASTRTIVLVGMLLKCASATSATVVS